MITKNILKELLN
jgi:hypothetical protein